MTGTIHVGIAGWSYPDWKDIVYPRGCKDTLRFCASFVDCIEINSTFYRPPVPAHCASWARRTRDLACFFTAKLPQRITHEQTIDAEIVYQVREGFAPLIEAGKLHALLAQFNYRFTATPENVQHLRRIAEAFGDLAPIAVEVRQRSWTRPDALARARELGISLANLDYPGETGGFDLRRTGVYGPDGVAYLRLHGRNRAAWFSKEAGRDETYDYLYAPREVKQIGARAGELAGEARRVIVIANNHFQGKELKTALELAALLRRERVPVPRGMLETYPDLKNVAAGVQRGLFDEA